MRILTEGSTKGFNLKFSFLVNMYGEEKAIDNKKNDFDFCQNVPLRLSLESMDMKVCVSLFIKWLVPFFFSVYSTKDK